MQLFNYLTSMINPSIGLTMVRKQLEKQLKKKVPNFDIMFIESKNKLQFNIEGIFYDFANENLKKILKSELAKQQKNAQSIDVVIASVDQSNTILVKLYITENGEKKIITYKL